MILKQVSILGLPMMILCENAVFVFFVKAQVARKRVILHKSFFHKSCLGKYVLGTNGNVPFAKN